MKGHPAEKDEGDIEQEDNPYTGSNSEQKALNHLSKMAKNLRAPVDGEEDQDAEGSDHNSEEGVQEDTDTPALQES